MIKTVSIWSALLLNQTIPGLNDPGKEGFENICWKRKKIMVQAFYPFSTMFPTFPKRTSNVSVTFILSSANTFNLKQFIQMYIRYCLSFK